MKKTCAGRICLCLTVCLLISLLSGCSDPVGRAVTHKDLAVILPADFLDLSGEECAEEADFLYGWHTLVFKGLAESKKSLPAMTLQQYTDYVVAGNKLTCTPEANGEGYLFTYEKPVGDTTYTYTVATYEGQENFWILQFYCPKDNLAENQPEIDVILEGIKPK